MEKKDDEKRILEKGKLGEREEALNRRGGTVGL